MATRIRRQRSAREALLTIVLGFELIVVGLVALVVFGLKAAPGEPWFALVGGGVVIITMIISMLTLNRPTGVILGWAVQLVIVLSGIFVAEIYVVAAMFLALWIFGLFKGNQIDSRNAAFLAQQESAPSAPTH